MCQQNDRSHLWVYSAVFKVWARAYVLHRRACAGPWPFDCRTSVSIHSFGHQGNIGQHVENGFWLFLVFVYSKFCLLKFGSIRSVKMNWEIRHTKTDKSHTWWLWPVITSKAHTGSEGVKGLSGLQSKVMASLENLLRPYLKIKTKTKAQGYS